MAKEDESRRAVERAARESYGRLVALLSRVNHDVACAEDALAEAFDSALRQWPSQGVPRSPEGWLLAIARRRLTDASRRRATQMRFQEHLKLISEELEADRQKEQNIPDHRLGLMFACAHPAIEPHIRTPLILQTILGFTAENIAAAYLTSPATMAQRLVRAKARIKRLGIPVAVPEKADLPQRLDDVLQGVYAAYTKGWSEAGDGTSSRLAEEAVWLSQVIVDVMPDEPEAKGLLSLILFLEARRDARSAADGSYVPLDDQDTGRWKLDQIQQAELLLHAANRLEGSGRFQIEAAIQSAHVARRLKNLNNWAQIVALYDALSDIAPTPVVGLNRIVARARRDGAAHVVEEIERLGHEQPMNVYQPYWAARGMIFADAGRHLEAREAYTVALGLTTDVALRTFLLQRIALIPSEHEDERGCAATKFVGAS